MRCKLAHHLSEMEYGLISTIKSIVIFIVHINHFMGTYYINFEHRKRKKAFHSRRSKSVAIFIRTLNYSDVYIYIY